MTPRPVAELLMRTRVGEFRIASAMFRRSGFRTLGAVIGSGMLANGL